MNVGVLVSGTGTNLQALLDAEARGELAPAQITIVISNNPAAPALVRATAAGKPALAIDHRGMSREAFEDLLIAGLRDVELVVLAGFMRVLTPHFLARFTRPVINTHPSLLPAFPGMDAPGQAISAGVRESGVTVHVVDQTVDGGAILAQVPVPIVAGDTPASLHARIQAEEHRLLPRIVREIAAGQIVFGSTS
ncbi:MAG TPA: phosphoribosylglycinamide formyltransferase [Kofleriaceae bacterium]